MIPDAAGDLAFGISGKLLDESLATVPEGDRVVVLYFLACGLID
jgi:hypothetical protein